MMRPEGVGKGGKMICWPRIFFFCLRFCYFRFCNKKKSGSVGRYCVTSYTARSMISVSDFDGVKRSKDG